MFRLATKAKHPGFTDCVYLPTQTERACRICGIVKITAFPDHGEPFRLWRLAGEEQQFMCDWTPECVPAVPKAAPDVSAA